MSGIGGAANTMGDIGRPTSRVLAPPGGGSSNIFGTEPVAAPTKASRTGRANQQSCDIFGAPIRQEAAPVKTAPTQTAAPTPAAAPAARTVQPPTNETNGVSKDLRGSKVTLSQTRATA